MAKGEEETARKLALLEGDRRAYHETAQTQAKGNAQKIADLRKENKALIARLRSLKDPGVAATATGPRAVELLDTKASEQIKRHNALRHQSSAKIKRIEELEKMIGQLTLAGDGAGKGSESQTLRELENRLDKAVIKAQEAQFVGKTYRQIIEKLQQDRLTFDGRVTALENTIAARRADIARLEAMLADAASARDSAKADLARAESETQTARAAREQEKRALQALADERRRQHEALEKRLRLASVGETKEELGQSLPQDLTLRLAAYEKAMGRLQDAAGVSDAGEVVTRFAGQGQTAAHLATLIAQNTETHTRLKTEHEQAQARLDAVQYSGGADGPSRVDVEAAQARARTAEDRLVAARGEAEAAQKQLAFVRAGIDNLSDRLQRDRAAGEPAPAGAPERLGHVAVSLRALVASLGQRQDELAAMHDADLGSIVDLPTHNLRVKLGGPAKDEEASEEDSGDEAVSRDSMKKQAASLVEARTAKPKKKKGRDGDDDD